MSNPRKKILDMAMDSEIEALHQQLRAAQQEKEKLVKENEKLKKHWNGKTGICSVDFKI